MASDYLLSQYIQQTLQIPVFALHAPVNASFPCVVYEKLSSLGSISMDGPAYSTDVFTFSVKSKVSLAQARLYGSQINALLNGYENQVFSVANSYSEEWDDSEEVYVVSQNFQCIVGATLPFYNVVRGDGVSGSIAVWNDKFALTSSNNIIVSGSDIRITGNLTVVGTIDNQISSSLLTASYAVRAETASYMAGAIESASYAATAAFALNVPATASHALVADIATTASYALNTPTLPSGLVSSSAQVLNNTGIYSSSVQLPSGLVSASSQIDYNDIQNKPEAVVTASYAVSASYAPTKDGVVSSSTQFKSSDPFTIGALSAATISTPSTLNVGGLSQLYKLELWPSGSTTTTEKLTIDVGSLVMRNGNLIVTGSIKVRGSLTGSLQGTSSYALRADTASYALNAVSASYAPLPGGVVSSSAQVFDNSGVYSSSLQLPAGIVSSSAQVLVGTNIYSSSIQLPSGLVSASAQIDYNGIQNKPTSIESASYALTASHCTSVPATSSWAMNAVSASYAPAQPAISASYAATASSWNGYGIWVGTKTAYGALGTYSATTLYFIQ